MKVLLIDDHALLREGLALLLLRAQPDLTCLQAGSRAEALLQLAEHPDLDLVLYDLGLPDGQGVAGLRSFQAALNGPALVVLSGDDAPPTVLDCINAGAAGFIPKTAQFERMQAALAQVLRGEIYLPPQLLQSSPTGPVAALDEPLSGRQLEVLRLLIAGHSNKLISRELTLADSTVKTHLEAIFRKLGVNTRTQAVVAAARLGLSLKAQPNA